MRNPILFSLSLVACSAKDDPAAVTAATPPWPEWAFHHWVWEDESTQESALALVDDYLARDIPVGAIIIDSPWATGYSTFEWDNTLFPDPQAMIDTLHDQGVRVIVWTVPGINTDQTALYEEAAANGWFMAGDDGGSPKVVDWWKGEGSLIDYFNEDAVDWWHGLIDQTLAYDIDGWKCDGLDFSAIIADYSPGAGREVGRLEYSHAYYRDFFDYTRSQLGEDRLITARPIDNYGADLGGDVVAFAPVDINWAGWVGDQDPSFAGMQAALNNMYWSAEYNYIAFGSDIGGYRDDSDLPLGRDKELLIRWAQLGALNPVMENGGAGEHRPWMFDDETTTIYRDFTKLHYALLPYLMAQGDTAFADGESLFSFLSKERFTYLLGSDLLVAPVLEAGGEFVVDFPDGDEWIDLFDSSKVYGGGFTLSDSVSLNRYPVFVRANSDIADDLAGGAFGGE
jgi:alpha-glucosidase (family GH31 glycosyl hydrolase)